MTNELINFLDRIRVNSEIDYDDKKELIDFLKGHLFSHVVVFTSQEYAMLESILEDFDYNLFSFRELLDISYNVRNSIGNKGTNKTIPKANYVYAVHKMFKEFNMDMWTYDKNYGMANIALARGAYNIVFNNELINGEVSFVDLTKDICDKYYKGKDINRSVCKVLKYLHWVRKGIDELEEKYDNIVSSEEFKSMFELTDSINELHFNELITEFYPVLENELFSLIKKAVENSNDPKVSNDYVMNYINNVINRRETFSKQKDKVIEEVKKIDDDVEEAIEHTFSDFLSSIENNRNISIKVSKNIIDNIRNAYNIFSLRQEQFIGNEYDNFFNNCYSYMNGLIASNDKNGIDELINVLVNNCKDFFVEYDAKKFKEIVDYILENTDITAEELKGVGEKCARFFKDADINKLKAINKSLKEFKSYINNNFKENINDNIFDSILVNNPDLLLNNSKIDEVFGFLKGDISLDDSGYKYPNFRLEKDFLSFNFYKRLKSDNYSALLNGSLGRVIQNLNYLEEAFAGDIDFSELNFNEDMIYLLLSKELYSEGTNTIYNIRDLFNSNDYKKIMELNPELLLMPSEDLEITVQRCMLNENEDYSFYDLLASELYFYRVEDYKSRSVKELIDGEFKYVNLSIESNREFDPEDIATSRFIDNGNTYSILEAYNERKINKDKLEKLLPVLSFDSPLDSMQLNEIINIIMGTYNTIYDKVPNITYKNKIIELINNLKDKKEYEISDIKEEIDSKKTSMAAYDNEKKDTYFVVENLNDLLKSIDSDSVRSDIEKFLRKFKENHTIKNENKEGNLSKVIKEMEERIIYLDREVEYLDYLLSVLNFKNPYIDYVYEDKKKFKIKELHVDKSENYVTEEASFDEILNNHTVVLFADSIDLNEIPNDRNFIEKISKFLGDNEFSITSKSFMEANSLNNDFVKKMIDHRDGVFSRRENRTPVRVYFIPIKNKHFYCYYVIGVNYKDHAHLDAGCSTDAVYNRRMKEAKSFERMLDELSYDELIDFIEESKEKYNVVMKPIVDKIEMNDKKRKGKK